MEIRSPRISPRCSRSRWRNSRGRAGTDTQPRRQGLHLRYHPARRRAVARVPPQRGPETDPGPPARTTRRRRDRGRVSDLLGRGLRGDPRGGQAGRDAGERAVHLRPLARRPGGYRPLLGGGEVRAEAAHPHVRGDLGHSSEIQAPEVAGRGAEGGGRGRHPRPRLLRRRRVLTGGRLALGLRLHVRRPLGGDRGRCRHHQYPRHGRLRDP